MKKVEECCEYLRAGENKTLIDEKSEAKAKMYIKARDDLKIVNVDHELIEENQGVKKCDFLALGMHTNNTHFIELKGVNIEEAFKQIKSTIDYLAGNAELKNWVVGREILDSYIVSPERQKIPNIHSNEEKELAKKLIRGRKRRPEDMFQLIHFVKVVASQKRLAESGRQMISSGRAPVELD